MIKVTVCEKALQLSPCIFRVKEQNVSGFSSLNELLLGDGVLRVIQRFNHGFYHNFILFSLVINNLFKPSFPYFSIIFLLGFNNHILAFA
jgi:hypothetical protein